MAVTVIPGGACETESPWLIHTDCWSGCPLNRVDDVSSTFAGVDPNSDKPVFSTVPPSTCAMAWNP